MTHLLGARIALLMDRCDAREQEGRKRNLSDAALKTVTLLIGSF